jgi:hypothetical protein
MKVQQLSIFLENKQGRLAEVANILANALINIRAATLADTSDFGVVRLIVDDVDKAVAILHDEGITAVKTDIIVVDTSDKPGGLAKVLNIIELKNLNVEYLYSLGTRNDRAFIILRFDDPDKAIRAFLESGIRVVGREDLRAENLA